MIQAKTHKIDTEELLDRLIAFSKNTKSPYFVVDVETNSKSEKLAELYGIGVCFDDRSAFYISMRTNKGAKVWNSAQEAKIADWLLETSKTKKLVNHNIVYDVLVIERNLKVDLTPHIYSDTILLKHAIDEEPPFGLKECAVRDLGAWADNAQNKLKDSVIANGGKWTKEQKDMYLAETDILAEYCMWDVLLTYKLFVLYDKKLREEKLEKLFYDEETMPLYRECTIPMKRNGFPVDIPYFEQLNEDITKDIQKLEDEIQAYMAPEIEDFEMSLLDKEVPIKNTGNFPKMLAEELGIPLPLKKKIDKETKEVTFNVTLGAKDVAKQKEATPEYAYFYDWLLNGGKPQVEEMILYMLRKRMFLNLDKFSGQKYVFNLSSNDHLAHYFFKIKGYKPKDKTAKGKDKLDASFIDSLAEQEKDPIAEKLIEYKKLQKLQSTYISGILTRQIDGVIYTSMLQFGTTSGRYSSRDPNLQNLPRVKDDESGLSELVLKYVNAIKKGFIAGPGRTLVNADYSSLEPVCFAHMSNEDKIRDIFKSGKDLYSQVAIDVNKLEDQFSAHKKADNFLKKHRPELRQLWKVPTLGIVYGMEEARLVQAIGCDFKEAEKIIKDYLGTYKNIHQYMKDCEKSVKQNGYVRTVFGRLRHIPLAKSLYQQYGNELKDYRWARANNKLAERREFKQALNNSKNFPIQGLAAHIVNRAMIAIARKFKEFNLNAYIVMQVHDEITCICAKEQAEQVKNIIKECMETTTVISVPLVAEPLIAENWAEAK